MHYYNTLQWDGREFKSNSGYLYLILWTSILFEIIEKAIKWREVGALVRATLTRAWIAIVSARVLVTEGVSEVLFGLIKENMPELKEFALSKGGKFIN